MEGSEIAEGSVAVALEPETATLLVEETALELVVEDADEGIGAYEVTVTVDDSSTLVIDDATVPREDALVNISITEDGDVLEMDVALLDDTFGPGTHTIAEIRLAGQSDGTAAIEIDEIDVGDQVGTQYTISESRHAALTLAEELALTESRTEPIADDARLQFSRPAVGESAIYHGGLGTAIGRLPSADGELEQRWAERAGALSDSSPVIQDGTVFVGSGSGTLYAFDSDGAVHWQYETTSAITSTPAVTKETVYVGANDGTVHAIDTDSGEPAWEEAIDVGAPVYTELAVADGRLFLTTADGRLVALDATERSLRWEEQMSTRFESSSPVVDGETVYLAAEELIAFTVGDEREERWRHAIGGTAGSSPVVVDETVYVGSADGSLYAVAADDGQEQWSRDVGDSIAADPAHVAAGIVAASQNGTIALFGTDGTERALLEQDGVLQAPLAATADKVYAGFSGQLTELTVARADE